LVVGHDVLKKKDALQGRRVQTFGRVVHRMVFNRRV
jgi:hypothetical protein